MKTALVTGASGFIGGRLAQVLAAEGVRVRAQVRTPGRARHLETDPAIEVVQADLGDPAAVARLVPEVDTVFHCAGNVRPWARWEAYERDNVLATRNLVAALAAAPRPPRRVVHFSTVDVYGYPEQPASEASPVVLDTFGYGKSKALGEQEARRLAGHRIAFTVVRPTNVFGPRGQFVAEVGSGLRSRVMLTVDGGRAHAGLVFVDNLVANVLRAARAEAAAGGTFNLRDDFDVTWREYLDRLADGIRAPRCFLDLGWRAAWALATALEAPHRLLGLAAEPLLHRLIVCMFGRTCAHSAELAGRVFGARTEVGFDQALASSVAWFNDPARPRG